MVGTVYQGSIDGPGMLFAGLTFFLWVKIPIRDGYMHDIRINGGTIVDQEEAAHFCIYDHVKPKFAPPDSVSWTFIQDSLKRGVVEDRQAHLIHHMGYPPHRIASGASASSTQTTETPFMTERPHPFDSTPPRPIPHASVIQTAPPHTRVSKRYRGKSDFTRDDDRILRLWVQKGLALGMADQGTKLYDQLAAQHPGHTSQSWRQRWVKKLKKERPTVMVDDGSQGPVLEIINPRSTQPSVYQQRDAPREVPAGDMKKALDPFSQEYSEPISGPTTLHDPDSDLSSSIKSRVPFSQESSQPNRGPTTSHNLNWDVSSSLEIPNKAIITTSKRCRRRPSRDTSSPAPPLSPATEQKVSGSEQAFSDGEIQLMTEIARVSGKTVQPEQMVCNVPMRLYDLWELVHCEFGGMDEVDDGHLWPLVAKELGIVAWPYAPWELRSLYQSLVLPLGSWSPLSEPQLPTPSTSPN